LQATVCQHKLSKEVERVVPDERYLKFGGVRFRNNVPPEEINTFVARLPAGKRVSLFQVAKELERAGLISLEEGSLSTIDEEMIPCLEGEKGPEDMPDLR
jgi:hypothetical protein